MTVECNSVFNSNDVRGPLGIALFGKIEIPIMADSGSPITILSDVMFFDKWQGSITLTPKDINPKAFGEFDIEMLG